MTWPFSFMSGSCQAAWPITIQCRYWSKMVLQSKASFDTLHCFKCLKRSTSSTQLYQYSMSSLGHKKRASRLHLSALPILKLLLCNPGMLSASNCTTTANFVTILVTFQDLFNISWIISASDHGLWQAEWNTGPKYGLF